MQELEESIERWQSGRKIAVSTKIKIDELETQNKCYREAIEFGIEYLKNSDIRQVQLVVTTLKSALEGEE